MRWRWPRGGCWRRWACGPIWRPRAQPITKVVATQGHPGEGAERFALIFDSAEIEEGPIGHMLEDRFLHAALLAAMQRPRDPYPRHVRHRPPRHARRRHARRCRTGATLSARLLVGADGRQSGVARRAGIGRVGWCYGQTALVAAIGHERPHGGIAHQFFMPTGPLAILPLPGNRSSIVWSEPTASAAAIAALDDGAFLDVVRPRFGDFLGKLSLAGPRFTYPLSLTMAHDYVAPRIALVGDSAHGVHPIAGQGLNMGLRDVAALAEVLVEAHRRGEDIGAVDVLDRYQSWRRFDATAMGLGMDGVNRLFSNDNPILRAGRGLGMGAITAIGPLRRGFMRQAAGLSIDPMPRLLTGRRL